MDFRPQRADFIHSLVTCFKISCQGRANEYTLWEHEPNVRSNQGEAKLPPSYLWRPPVHAHNRTVVLTVVWTSGMEGGVASPIASYPGSLLKRGRKIEPGIKRMRMR